MAEELKIEMMEFELSDGSYVQDVCLSAECGDIIQLACSDRRDAQTLVKKMGELISRYTINQVAVL